MERRKAKKVYLTGFENVYSFLKAGKILNKDWRTVKKMCEKNNIEVLEVNKRYYLTDTQIKQLQEL